eukprot:1158938-Pelagomonas_calceolata.AAC.5
MQHKHRTPPPECAQLSEFKMSAKKAKLGLKKRSGLRGQPKPPDILAHTDLARLPVDSTILYLSPTSPLLEHPSTCIEPTLPQLMNLSCLYNHRKRLHKTCWEEWGQGGSEKLAEMESRLMTE